MSDEIAIDRDLGAFDHQRNDVEPLRIRVVGGVARQPLPQENDVRDDSRALAFEGVRRQANGSHKIGLGTKVLT